MGGSQMPELCETNIESAMSSLSIVNTSSHDHVPMEAPIVSSYNERIRPLLDTVDKLRNLNVMRQGIQLPTIVVVGDQSSGKSSVIESLTGIGLPRGDGICTRVPLVIRLQRSLSPEPEIWLEYSGKRVDTDKEHITEAICAVTDEIAGSGKGVSDIPLTLHVKKAGVPDLTMVDLPGLTLAPVTGQPENIDEQISSIVMKYIEPQESIILNVLSPTVDFGTSKSICMSRKVDDSGERTLAVVTKADMAPERLLQQVTADDVSSGLGYICVRNRIGDETYQKARKEEELLFKTHPLLSMIDDDIVGIPVLAQKLIQIQARMITRCLPDIVQKIDKKMDNSLLELNKLPMVMTSVGEALMTFMNIIGSAKESLQRILVQGDFSEYPNDQSMHSTARLAEKLSKFSDNLQGPPQAVMTEFLMDEIKVLEECKSIGLPNFTPRSAFLTILSQRVDEIHTKPVEFIREVWDYVEVVLSSVLTKYSENFPQIQSSIKRAGRNLIFINAVLGSKQVDFAMTGFGNVPISHLRNYPDKILQQAFDMKMRITAYWTIVERRIVENIALFIQYSVKQLLNSQLQEIVKELVNPKGGGEIERMLEESPSVASKRENLKSNINLLKESKDAVTTIVSDYGDQRLLLSRFG